MPCVLTEPGIETTAVLGKRRKLTRAYRIYRTAMWVCGALFFLGYTLSGTSDHWTSFDNWATVEVVAGVWSMVFFFGTEDIEKEVNKLGGF